MQLMRMRAPTQTSAPMSVSVVNTGSGSASLPPSSGGVMNWVKKGASFVGRVTMSYTQFLAPIGIFLTINMCFATHMNDGEKFALQWLHYSNLPEADRDMDHPRTDPNAEDGEGLAADEESFE